jgi:hypothetical protein
MAVARDPTSPEIARFLATRSTDQMLRIMSEVREPMAQMHLTNAMLLLPPVVAAESAPPEKAKKALNAFVGYRCKYTSHAAVNILIQSAGFYIAIPVLKPWPMKKLSNLMGVMWEGDPNKSLWSLMAKAWSIIRDQVGKDNAPLDQFFQIVCPFLNIPPPEVYLDYCGWTLGSDKDGNPAVSKLPSQRPKAPGAGIAPMALSVEDILKCCMYVGYAQGFTLGPETESPTFLAQPSSATNPPVNPQTQPAVPTFESRLAARNDRRARRGTARDTGVAAHLRQQVTDARGMSVAQPHDYDSDSGVDEPVQLHHDLMRVLTNHHMGQTLQDITGEPFGLLTSDQSQQGIAGEPCDLLAAGQAQQDIAGEPFEFLAAGDPIMTAWTYWDAFADENATLPNFDGPTL